MSGVLQNGLVKCPGPMIDMGDMSLVLPVVSSPYVDESAMSATFVVCTGTPDRDRDSIFPSGVDLTDYQNNPVVLWNHGLDTVISTPIARCENPSGVMDLRVYREAEVMEGTAWFTNKNLLSEQMFGLVVDRIVRAASIHVMPDFNAVVKTDVKGMQVRVIPKSKMIEWSLGCLGVNPEAVAKTLSKNSICDRPIEASLAKTLRFFAPRARGNGVGFGLGVKKTMATAMNEKLAAMSVDELKLAYDEADDDEKKCIQTEMDARKSMDGGGDEGEGDEQGDGGGDDMEGDESKTAKSKKKTIPANGKKNGAVAKGFPPKKKPDDKTGDSDADKNADKTSDGNATENNGDKNADKPKGKNNANPIGKKNANATDDDNENNDDDSQQSAAAAGGDDATGTDDVNMIGGDEDSADGSQEQQIPLGAAMTSQLYNWVSEGMEMLTASLTALENPIVKEGFTSFLATLDGELDKLQGLYAEQYPDAPNLETDDDEMDEVVKTFLARCRGDHLRVTGFARSLQTIAKAMEMSPVSKKHAGVLKKIAGSFDTIAKTAFTRKGEHEAELKALKDQQQQELNKLYAGVDTLAKTVKNILPVKSRQ